MWPVKIFLHTDNKDFSTLPFHSNHIVIEIQSANIWIQQNDQKKSSGNIATLFLPFSLSLTCVTDDWVYGLTFEMKRNRWNALTPPPLT